MKCNLMPYFSRVVCWKYKIKLHFVYIIQQCGAHVFLKQGLSVIAEFLSTEIHHQDFSKKKRKKTNFKKLSIFLIMEKYNGERGLQLAEVLSAL